MSQKPEVKWLPHKILRRAAKILDEHPMTCYRAVRLATPYKDEIQHHREATAAMCKFSDCYWVFDQLYPSWFGYPGSKRAQEHRVLALLFAAEVSKDTPDYLTKAQEARKA